VVQSLGMSGAAANGSPQPTGTGTLTGQVTDASNAAPIAGALVTVQGTGQSDTTDASGNYTILNVPAGSRTVTASAAGYISSTQTTTVSDGGTTTLNFALSPAPTGTGEIRAVLSWGAIPRDLDLHVSGPLASPGSGRFHVYFAHSAQVDGSGDPYCQLDVDDTNGNGPETQTITISNSEGDYVAGDYHVWVHNFSGDATFEPSGATLNLFDRFTQRGSFAQSAVVNPTNGTDDQRIWKIVNFTIDDAGNMTVVAPVQAMDDGGSGDVF
jgi:uncharacterized protein YfaP (DUF2135 family)